MELTEWYTQFKHFIRTGNDPLIHNALTDLINSFENWEQHQKWAYTFLDMVFNGQKMSQTLYDTIIFPVLYDGYQQNNAVSMQWMAKTIKNLKANPILYAKIQYASAFDLLKKSYLLMPSEELRVSLLNETMRWLNLCIHEYPMVLYGINGATITECLLLLDDLEFARLLDIQSLYHDFLDDFERKITHYRESFDKNMT